jgi:hypothetical protein
MMNSTNDADGFSDNPFRSGDGNSNNNNGGEDLFATPNAPPQQFQQPPPPQQQQQQQQQFQPQQQQPPPQPNQFQQQQQQQQQFQPQPMAGPMDSGGLQTQQQRQMSNVPPEQPRSWWGSCLMCLSLDTYRAYFDIDADDILLRMKSAIFDCYKPEHFRNNVVGTTKTDSIKGPDLYGPFWIAMTLVFFVAVRKIKQKWKQAKALFYFLIFFYIYLLSQADRQSVCQSHIIALYPHYTLLHPSHSLYYYYIDSGNFQCPRLLSSHRRPSIRVRH